MIYLDYAASTPADDQVLDTFYSVSKKYYANPNSIYKVHWLNEDSYVVRGGDYLSGKKKCRVSYRACWSQKNKDKTIGLRLIIANDCV